MSEEDVQPPSEPEAEQGPELIRVRVRKRRRVSTSTSSHRHDERHGHRWDSNSRHHHRSRRRFRVTAAVIVVVVLVILLGGAFGGIEGYRSGRALESEVAAQFTSGKADLESGKTLLNLATSQRSAADLTAAQAKFTSAQGHFLAAEQRTRNSRLVRDGQDLPFLGSYISPRATAIEQLSVAGSSLAQVAQAAARIDGKLITPPTGTSAPVQLVDALQSSTPDLNVIQSQLGVAQRALKQVQPAVLPSGDRGTVSKLRSIVGGGVKGVVELRSLIPVLAQMLGMNGPQTYLIEQVNPAELRAGGGYIGSYSVMQANQGAISVTLSQGSAHPKVKEGQAGYVAPPGPLQQLIGNNTWSLDDSNFYPSFVQDGQAGLSMLQHDLGIQAQGVISVDPTAIADLLKVIGPQRVPGWNVTIDSSNFANYIFQFENSSGAPPDRKSFFGDAAGPIISALAKLPASRWPQLISILNEAATGRDLQAYFTNPQVESEMDRVGWSGDVNPDQSPDFFLDTESNLSASKANHFLQRTYHVALSTSGDQLVHQVTVDLKDSEPAGYEANARQYGAYVRLYVPANATNLKVGNLLADKISTTEQPPPGLQMRDGWVYIANDSALGYGTWTYTFQYDTPDKGGTQQIYWQKEPGTEADTIDVSWTFGDQTYKASTTLTQDKVLSLTSTGVTVADEHAATAQLPSLGF